MSKIISFAGLMLLLSLPCYLNAQQPFLTTNDVRKLDDSIERMMLDVGIPGLSLAVIKDNKIVYFRAYGYKDSANKEPVNSETIFEAGSLTKSALVFITYKLVDEGLLDLDKPMYEYLEYAPLAHDPRYRLITPRMILSHCSGIENDLSDNNPDTLDILSNPGERFVYSGQGYVYLSKVIELILHKQYKDYVSEMVIRPLGLKRSYTQFSPDKKYPQNYALPHTVFGKELEKGKQTDPYPAGSMNMTASDYAKLFIAIFNGKFLSESRIRDIMHPIIQLDRGNPDLFYGPGFELLIGKGDTIVAHGGSTGGFKAGVYYSAVTKDGFVYLVNSDRGDIIVNRINQLTVGFNLDGFFKSDLFAEYPSDAVDLIGIYNHKGASAMSSAVRDLERTGDSGRIVKALDEIGVLFLDEDKATARRLLEDAVAYRRESAISTYLLGEAYLASAEYKLAYDMLVKARELHFDLVPMDYDLKVCTEKMNEKAIK